MKSGVVRISVALLFVLMVLGLAACNTMEGFGEDVEAAGEEIEEEAE